jgi:hypothetical protein
VTPSTSIPLAATFVQTKISVFPSFKELRASSLYSYDLEP